MRHTETDASPRHNSPFSSRRSEVRASLSISGTVAETLAKSPGRHGRLARDTDRNVVSAQDVTYASEFMVAASDGSPPIGSY